MTAKEALEKHNITFAKWDLFLSIAKSNVNPPNRKKREPKKGYKAAVAVYMKKSPAWAYIGGMRDALWAWVGADREAYAALEADLTREAAIRIKEVSV